jgi:3-phenylpropionate/trans-cinnamate dioxygenase ferredoxin reductase component
MTDQAFTYVIVGAGLAGVSAIDGIRERDASGSILLIGKERHLPYDRPPLSKQLWFGKKRLDDIFLRSQAAFEERVVALKLGRAVTRIDLGERRVTDEEGVSYRYEKLLLATGGVPRALTIPGGDLDGILYYRTLDDYMRLREAATAGRSALVIGGGFIGSEIAAALATNNVEVTIVFPDAYLVSRIFPEALGTALTKYYRERGVTIAAGVRPTGITREGDRWVTETDGGQQIASDILIAGIGIAPSTALAEAAGLRVGNGIEVDECLRSSDPNVFAAGDGASFPYQALGKRMRVEHWDNAKMQGLTAGRNMAGASEPYAHLPYFFSDLFEFGYEAVGEVSSALATVACWREEYRTGVIYYLADERVRGVMLCNVWEKIEAARELIRKGERMAADALRNAIV